MEPEIENDPLVQLAATTARMRLDQLKIWNEIDRLKATTVPSTNPDYISVLGYANTVLRLSFPNGQLSAWSKRVGQYCKEKNIKIETTFDPTYGAKKLYPVKVIRETYDTLGPKVKGEEI